MLKVKFLSIIVFGLVFTLMNYSCSSDDLYTVSFQSHSEKSNTDELENSAWIGAVGRLAVQGTRYAVRYTREVTRVSAPAVADALRQAIMHAHIDGHSKELYASAIEDFKEQQIRNLD